MDAATPTSCILCYEADELGSMVEVEFASRDGLRLTRVVLCRRCAAAISAALAAVLADEDQSEHERHFDRAVDVSGPHRPIDDWGASNSNRVGNGSDSKEPSDRDPQVDEDER
jgi:hypothetical protein